jgi:FtsH-binding integral membrane protein
MSAPSFSEDQYKTDTMNPIKAQAVPSAPPAVKGSYRSVSQGYDNVPDIELGAGDAVDAHVQRQMRLGFIRKVYGILTCQLALTTIVCSVLALNGACRRFVMTTPSLMYIGMFGSLGVFLALMAFKNQHPLNAQLLFVWTLMEAYTVGVVCASYTAAGQGRIVIEALVLTAAIFASLTLYTVYSKRDWSFMEAGLSSGLLLLIFWGLFSLFFPALAGGLYSLFGALLFSGFIIFDTWQITERLGYDDHILASIMLYLDILNLFLHILRLLSPDRN